MDHGEIQDLALSALNDFIDSPEKLQALLKKEERDRKRITKALEELE